MTAATATTSVSRSESTPADRAVSWPGAVVPAWGDGTAMTRVREAARSRLPYVDVATPLGALPARHSAGSAGTVPSVSRVTTLHSKR